MKGKMEMRTTTKHSGRIEIKPALKAIEGMRQTWLSAYKAACKYEDITEDAKFVIFSDDNPFLPFIDRAYIQYCEMKLEYQAGGYVGLSLT
jgi:hypothetical protein